LSTRLLTGRGGRIIIIIIIIIDHPLKPERDFTHSHLQAVKRKNRFAFSRDLCVAQNELLPSPRRSAGQSTGLQVTAAM
jgi:hypothetical protein